MMLVTFYNAVICSLILLGSVFWGDSISQFDRGKLKSIVSRSCHLTVLRDSMEKKLQKN